MPKMPQPATDIKGARILAKLGHSVDHRPHLAGGIHQGGQPGREVSAGARRQQGRLQLLRLAARQSRGDGARDIRQRPAEEQTRAGNRRRSDASSAGRRVDVDLDASEKYRSQGVPTAILAGKEYGSGSSRDWAGKGPALLGVRAVIAESYERIHRSNLVGMGVLPAAIPARRRSRHARLDGRRNLRRHWNRRDHQHATFKAGQQVKVTARGAKGETVEFHALVRIDTPQEAVYYKHGGILQFVLRQLLSGKEAVPETAGARTGAVR